MAHEKLILMLKHYSANCVPVSPKHRKGWFVLCHHSPLQMCHILRWAATPGATDASWSFRVVEVEIIRRSLRRHPQSLSTHCCCTVFASDDMKRKIHENKGHWTFNTIHTGLCYFYKLTKFSGNVVNRDMPFSHYLIQSEITVKFILSFKGVCVCVCVKSTWKGSQLNVLWFRVDSQQ